MSGESPGVHLIRMRMSECRLHLLLVAGFCLLVQCDLPLGLLFLHCSHSLLVANLLQQTVLVGQLGL